jgi:transposase
MIAHSRELERFVQSPTLYLISSVMVRLEWLSRVCLTDAGSLRAGKRAAAVMTLLNSARLNGHDPYAYMKDVLQRLPTHKMSAIGELLPHRWQPRQAVVIA